MEEFQVVVAAGIGALRPDHPAVLAAAAELEAMVRTRPAVMVERPRDDQNNGKGLFHDLVVNLGGGGAAAATALRAFRLWLERDQRRSLTIEHRQADGRVETVTVSGETVSDEAVRQAVESLGWRASGPGVATDPVHGAVAGGDDSLDVPADGE